MPPASLLTFLFTDIEGSTRRWESDGRAMSAALARHDAILRTAIEKAGGRVFKTVGDAFCAVFESAEAGVVAALEAQRGLATENWAAFGTAGGPASAPGFAPLRVRMALHGGEAEARRDDWFGPTLNRVARLLSSAHGGQVLISGRVAQSLGADGLAQVEAGLGMLDLGEHRLKDLALPERVWQLLAPDLQAEFPAILTLDRLRHNLPVQLSSFVGREREITSLMAALGASRLVTLTGVGGTGKTRLALQAAAEMLESQPDGVWFVDLAPLPADGHVAGAVAAAVGLPEYPGMPVADALVEWLLRRRLLLILDNCEHLVSDAASLAEQLLRRSPGLRILATSREALRLVGERQLALAPLAAPDPAIYSPGQEGTAVSERELERLAGVEAVRLFIDRARELRPEFTIGSENAAAVAEICARLDGIPLAIELAAARVRSLPPAEIAARLDDRFRLLSRGGRTSLPRQQTLRALIDWSYLLLPEEERQALRGLALFRGPAPMVACEAACAGGSLESGDVLDALASLVDKSLVLTEEHAGTAWYRLLETIREYASERLAEEGESDTARARLLAWSVASTERSGQKGGPIAGRTLTGLEVDLLRPTLMDLLYWAVKSPGQSAGAVALAGRRWADSWHFGRWRLVLPLMAAALERADEGTDALDLGWLLYEYANLAGRVDDADLHHVISMYQQAAGIFRSEGEQQGEAWAVQDEGHAWRFLNDLGAMLDCQERALALKQSWGAPAFDLGVTMANICDIHRSLGNEALALTWGEEAVRLQEAEGLTGFAHLALSNLGHILLVRGRVAEARARFEQAQGVDRDAGALSLLGLAGVAAARLAPRRAARLQAAAARIMNDHEWAPLAEADLEDWNRIDRLVRSQLSEADHAAAWAEGWAMDSNALAACAMEPDRD